MFLLIGRLFQRPVTSIENNMLTQFKIAVGLLVMMYPILCKVRFESLAEVFSHRGIWKQVGFSVFVNWIVAPFLMVRINQYLPLIALPYSSCS